jgi:hypothetical protein
MKQPVRFVVPAGGRDKEVARIAGFLAAALPGTPLSVEVKPYKPARSSEQNRYLWGVVYPAFLAVLEGWDARDVHEYLLGECFGWQRVQGLGKIRVKPLKRSSKLDKAEFSQYVDYCIRKGAEHGVNVPEPDHA